MALQIFYAAVCVFSFFVKYVTGFGNTLIMTTLFAFTLSPAFITPVDLLLNLPANLSVVWGSRKSVNVKRVLYILGFVLVGVLPGAFLLKLGNAAVMKTLLGLLVCGLGLQMLLKKESTAPMQPRLSPFILILCGFALGSYGVGALLAGYLGSRIADPQEFRGTLCSVFLFENLFRILTYWSTGLLTPESVRFDLFLLPFVLVGLVLGRFTLKYIKPAALKKGVQLLLVLSGASLCLNNLLTLI